MRNKGKPGQEEEKLKRGDIITIFEDPVTMKKPEGKAIVRVMHPEPPIVTVDGKRYRDWLLDVCFINYEEGGSFYRRYLEKVEGQ